MPYNCCEIKSFEDVPCEPGHKRVSKIEMDAETKIVKDELGNVLGYGTNLENGHLDRKSVV